MGGLNSSLCGKDLDLVTISFFLCGQAVVIIAITSLLHSFLFGRPCLNGWGVLLDTSDPRQGVSLRLFLRRVEMCDKVKWFTQASCILMTT